MGAALTAACLELGHDVIVITGPVGVDYPAKATVVPVLTTEEMLEAAVEHFEHCDGAIGAAAPCDYKPRYISPQKISKNGEALKLELIETQDVVATLGKGKRDDQWVVGFALETEDHRFRAIVKLERKLCDLMVSNDPRAIDSAENEVELLDRDGKVLATVAGSKEHVAKELMKNIDDRLIKRR